MSWIAWIVLGGLGLLIGIFARQSRKFDSETNELSRQTRDKADRQRQENEQLIKENEQKREDNIERHNMRLISLENSSNSRNKRTNS